MAADYILKITGVDGECQVKGHENQIDIMSWSIGMSNSGSASVGGGAGSGKVSFQDFHFTKHVDSSSNALQLRCAGGKPITEATMFVRKQGADGKQQEYIKITLSDFIVANYSLSGGGDAAMEQFSFNYAKYKFEYAKQKKDGSLEGYKPIEWDLKATSGS